MIGFVVEKLMIRNHTRRDDPCYFAPYNPLCLGGVLHLFAYGHPVPGPYQFGQIGLRCVIGNPAHWDLLRVAFVVSGCQGYAKDLGGDKGIIKKHFVEIAHPVKENGLRVLVFDLQILLEHGG